MGLLGTLFGGSKQKSSNQSYGYLKDSLGGVTGAAGYASDALQSLLSGDFSGFGTFAKNMGLGGALDQAAGGVTANAAARGTLRSGPTGTAYLNEDARIKNQYASDYIKNLLGLGQLGLGAGSVISGAGNTQSSNSSKGIGGFLGGVLSGGVL